MSDDKRQGTAGRWLVKIAVGVLIGVLTGLLINWQVAPVMVGIYFGVGWAADRGRKQKREIAAHREGRLNNRKRGGTEQEAGQTWG